MGGSFMYGLLGAELEEAANPDSPIQFEIRVSPASGPYPEALTPEIDYVETGLPEEYVAGVLGGARWAAEVGNTAGVRVRFCRAAHGAVGSSPVGFAMLAAIVVRILSRAHPELDAASCEDLVAWSRGAYPYAVPGLERVAAADAEP
jgi:hypothetical protein